MNTSDPAACNSSPALPVTMKELLITAIRDARGVNPGDYIPHHDNWHNPNPLSVDDRCAFCLAGAVIALTLKTDCRTYKTSTDFDARTGTLLRALDCMRTGDWEQAFRYVYQIAPTIYILDVIDNIPPPSHIDFDGWQEFVEHLSSLENTLPLLGVIDSAASKEVIRRKRLAGAELSAD